MESFISLLLVFLGGLFAGYVSGIVSGVGLISLPILLVAGLPVQVAIGTVKFGVFGMSAGSIAKYWSENQVKWKLVWPLSIIGIAAAITGSLLLVSADKALLTQMVGFVMLLFLPFILLNKELGIIERDVGVVSKAVGGVLFALAAIWGGFIGAGGGLLIFFVILLFYRSTVIQANATEKVIWLIISIPSFIIFAINGFLDWTHGLVLLLSTLIGGYYGAHTAMKKGNRWVKAVFVFLIIASAIKLLFF